MSTRFCISDAVEFGSFTFVKMQQSIYDAIKRKRAFQSIHQKDLSIETSIFSSLFFSFSFLSFSSSSMCRRNDLKFSR